MGLGHKGTKNSKYKHKGFKVPKHKQSAKKRITKALEF
jgi:hypothetical protein